MELSVILVDADEEAKLSRVTVTRLIGKKINTFKFTLIEYENEPIFPNSKFIEPESLYQRLKIKMKRLTPEAAEETFTFLYKIEKLKEHAKILPLCIPKMREATSTHIILEDDFEHFEICRANWYGIKHFQIVLETIAEFHAFSFHIKKLHERKRMRPFADANRFVNDEIFYNKKYAITRRLQRQEFHSHMFLIDQLNETESLRNDIKFVSHTFNVFSYCDPWAGDNLMFEYQFGSVKSCRLLDFKFIRYLPPSHDVLSVIYYNSTKKFRKECYVTLLNYYYEQLSERLKAYKYDPKEIYPRDAFDKACSDRLLTILFYNINYKVIALLGPKKFNEHFKDNSVVIDFLLDNRVNHIEQFMQKDECYRLNIIEEYTEFVSELMN
ncbi:uncharacterized protein LOC123301128 [Chrysoperla carnea]|uniref:uncharacterized protein LOC123301128 n=1 Tax=Chrysoperla carnea TaxID=189513 RepID=UPI001D05E530|nr:uncharacterized protein LOC123301128 [Chrysoperla carnea]